MPELVEAITRVVKSFAVVLFLAIVAMAALDLYNELNSSSRILF